MKPPTSYELDLASKQFVAIEEAIKWARHDLTHFDASRAKNYRKALLERLALAAELINTVEKLIEQVPAMEREPQPGGGWVVSR